MEDVRAPFLALAREDTEPPADLVELKPVANFPSDPFNIVAVFTSLMPLCNEVFIWVVSPPSLLEVSVVPGTNGTEAGFNVDLTALTSSHFSFWKNDTDKSMKNGKENDIYSSNHDDTI